MLDATDRETVGTIVAVRRVHVRRVKAQAVAVGACKCTTPIVDTNTCGGERTGRMVTVARSRIRSNHSIHTRPTEPHKRVWTVLQVFTL
jgi:hypothetical protein